MRLFKAAHAGIRAGFVRRFSRRSFRRRSRREWTVRDFKFHTGEVLPELRIGYTTVGEPTGEPVVVLHGTTGQCRLDADTEFRRRTVRRRSAARCEEVLHHHPELDRPRQVVEAVRRPAREIPEVQLRRHGRGAGAPAQGAPEDRPRAPRDRQFDGRHAYLALGAEISGLHGRGRADGRRSRPRWRAATG